MQSAVHLSLVVIVNESLAVNHDSNLITICVSENEVQLAKTTFYY